MKSVLKSPVAGIGILLCTGLALGQDTGPGKKDGAKPAVNNPPTRAPMSTSPDGHMTSPQAIIQHENGETLITPMVDLPPWDSVYNPEVYPLANGSSGVSSSQTSSGGFTKGMFGHGIGEAGQTAKYSQPVDCEQTCYFSNINSNLNPFVRYDDFTCNATGFITQVVFWAAGWDVNLSAPCKPFTNVAAVQIDFFDWVQDANCVWGPGRLLCSNKIPVADLAINFECDAPAFGGTYDRAVATLPTPCFQRVGQQFAIRIAGILANPDDGCILCWNANPNQIDCLGYSDDLNNPGGCGSPQDMSFELITERIDVVKYQQPPECENGFSYFSNLNSNLNPFVRYDDFICTATGDITGVKFWATGWDVNQGVACNLADNIDFVVVEIYEWIQGGTCGWVPGALLCAERFRLDELDPQFECSDSVGGRVQNLTARFQNPCFQEAGRHYAIRIAAVLRDPDNPCILCWQITQNVVDCQAYSVDRITGAELCANPDQAFEIITEPQDVVKYAQLNNCDSQFFSNLNSNVNPFLHYDDFVCTQTGLINQVNFWGGPWANTCDHSNIAGFEINIYEWQKDDTAACLWSPGNLLCTNFVSVKDANPLFECVGTNGENHFRYEANLANPCFQQVGRHYVIRIAARVINPDDACFWGWSRNPNTIDCMAYSEDRNFPGQLCVVPDPAFELLTEACRVQYFEFGQGLAGSGGFVPRAFGTDGTCDKGGHFLHVDQALGGTLSVLWIGAAQGITPFYGGTLYIDLGFPFTLIPINLLGPPGVPGAGFINLPGSDVNAFKGLTAYLQFSISDRGAVRGVSLTNAVQISIY